MKLIRLLCLMLALMTALAGLVSCRRGGDAAMSDTEPFVTAEKSESTATETESEAEESFLLNGAPIEEYTVVFPKKVGMMALGQRVVDAIAEKTGVTLKLENDGDTKVDRKEILIGATNRTLPDVTPSYRSGDGYVLGASDGAVFLYGADVVCTVKAVQAFEEMLFSLQEGARELLIETKGYASPDTSLAAMSFNVWINQETWQKRAPAVASVIRNVSPDTFGVQEADKKWMDYLSENLPGYAYVGEGRNGGTSGEYSAVFYRTSVFNLLESGTKWLSDTPDEVSKYEESSYIRIFTYALLQRKSDGKKIMHVNTHLDHQSATARKKQAAVLVEFLKQHKDVPVIVSGDFNTTQFSSDIAGMFGAGFVTSAEAALCSDGMAATFSTKVIDFIFVQDGVLDVYEYRVDKEKPNGIQPSDHNPIYIRYELK